MPLFPQDNLGILWEPTFWLLFVGRIKHLSFTNYGWPRTSCLEFKLVSNSTSCISVLSAGITSMRDCIQGTISLKALNIINLLSYLNLGNNHPPLLISPSSTCDNPTLEFLPRAKPAYPTQLSLPCMPTFLTAGHTHLEIQSCEDKLHPLH